MPEFVFISCGCSNESPQTEWLKTKHVYSCTVPEVRSPESVALDKVTALAGPCSLSLEAGDSPLFAPPHSVPQPASPRITCSSDSCHPCSFRLFLACSGRFLSVESRNAQSLQLASLTKYDVFKQVPRYGWIVFHRMTHQPSFTRSSTVDIGVVPAFWLSWMRRRKHLCASFRVDTCFGSLGCVRGGGMAGSCAGFCVQLFKELPVCQSEYTLFRFLKWISFLHSFLRLNCYLFIFF